MRPISSDGPPNGMPALVRNRGAERWDLEGFMGHRALSQTEVYAIGEFPSVQSAVTSIIEEIERAAPGSLHRTSTRRRPLLLGSREASMSP